jgi:hypothetical protein
MVLDGVRRYTVPVRQAVPRAYISEEELAGPMNVEEFAYRIERFRVKDGERYFGVPENWPAACTGHVICWLADKVVGDC